MLCSDGGRCVRHGPQHCYYVLISRDGGPHRLIHDQKMEIKNHDEQHDTVGDYVKSMIFGGLDGVLTSFAVVAGAAGELIIPRKVIMRTFREQNNSRDTTRSRSGYWRQFRHNGLEPHRTFCLTHIHYGGCNYVSNASSLVYRYHPSKSRHSLVESPRL